jgi:NADH-quinone oxidoreductase subunit G
VKTIMTRCIHCTRCVRFTTEVAGISELGLIGRGEDAEITTYLEKAMTSELQGNVIDLCPVGALTSRPYAFQARPWELTKTESIDVMDAVGSAIRIDTRGREVMRILPRINEAVNEEWISDKTRFVWDGMKTQRLDRPYLRKNGKLQPASWADAFAAIKAKIGTVAGGNVGAIAGDLAAVEEMYALQTLLAALGSDKMDVQARGALNPANGRASYLFNPTIAGIEDADAIMIVGSNPRKEAAILNTRIRKRWRAAGIPVGVIGEQADLRYSYNYHGSGPETLQQLAANGAPVYKKPLWLVGPGAYGRADGAALLSLVAKAAVATGAVREDWNGFAVLHTAAATVGALDLGLANAAYADCDVIFNLGADEIDIRPGAFVVYIGTHGDKGAHRADVILPAATYAEKSGTYVNTEGRVQMANRAGFAPGEAREDWAVIRALSDVLGKRLPFDSLSQLRARLYAAHPHFAAIDQIAASDIAAVAAVAEQGGAVTKQALISPVKDFYLTNPIARASAVMAECSKLAQNTLAVAAE